MLARIRNVIQGTHTPVDRRPEPLQTRQLKTDSEEWEAVSVERNITKPFHNVTKANSHKHHTSYSTSYSAESVPSCWGEASESEKRFVIQTIKSTLSPIVENLVLVISRMGYRDTKIRQIKRELRRNSSSVNTWIDLWSKSEHFDINKLLEAFEDSHRKYPDTCYGDIRAVEWARLAPIKHLKHQESKPPIDPNSEATPSAPYVTPELMRSEKTRLSQLSVTPSAAPRETEQTSPSEPSISLELPRYSTSENVSNVGAPPSYQQAINGGASQTNTSTYNPSKHKAKIAEINRDTGINPYWRELTTFLNIDESDIEQAGTIASERANQLPLEQDKKAAYINQCAMGLILLKWQQTQGVLATYDSLFTAVTQTFTDIDDTIPPKYIAKVKAEILLIN
ncbi:MAG: hypothetical protein HAW66_07840 [Shewanella sp.]|nr:hypothetical protein [Shewanella sp.]